MGDTFWDFLWSTGDLAFIDDLIILFRIIVDFFWRDRQTSGWIKAV